ncbi:MAG TPA: aminotransferase class V-fold PLP-dependent enzyme [bacterium]|nr:aminotransferase class V-fold PLP-dependent enzyme [bacterium]HPN42750.1 aminotransferase class V-fold PLP-dependent enzyme [bacterium]
MPGPLEHYFSGYRHHITGNQFIHPFPGGARQILYADWAASGRLYRPIEEYVSTFLGPYVANTHTETTLTGTIMTAAYHQAHDIIKSHVHAGPDDVLLFTGFGMTSVINKIQRILGLRAPDKYKDILLQQEKHRPLVIITHMEHHSNQTTWEECLCDVEIIRRNDQGLPDLDHLQEILQQNHHRPLIIGSFTACSNVTGIITPYHEMAEIVHEFGGYCFVDYSASAPYLPMDMHPSNPKQQLDAIFFSPHKFLGGPGSSGVIIFNKGLYNNRVPDQPGGGTVYWTNPWGEHRFYNDIEIREDGGTPGFLQAIKAALAVLLKEEMGVDNIHTREEYLKTALMEKLEQIPSLELFERQQKNRLGYVSFFATGIHHNLFVRLLNDKFGIQTRGGCACAGTYGHILFHIDLQESKKITDLIDRGDLSKKPGWVRVSLHPTMTDEEVNYIADAIGQCIDKCKTWENEYRFHTASGDYIPLRQNEFSIDIRETFRSS